MMIRLLTVFLLPTLLFSSFSHAALSESQTKDWVRSACKEDALLRLCFIVSDGACKKNAEKSIQQCSEEFDREHAKSKDRKGEKEEVIRCSNVALTKALGKNFAVSEKGSCKKKLEELRRKKQK